MDKDSARPIECLTMPIWPDAGKRLGIGRNAAYRAAARGEIPTIKVGSRLLVPKAAFDRMLGLGDGNH